MQFSRDRNPTPDSSNPRISCLPQHPLIDLNTLSDGIPTTVDSTTPRIVHGTVLQSLSVGKQEDLGIEVGHDHLKDVEILGSVLRCRLEILARSQSFVQIQELGGVRILVRRSDHFL